MPDINYKDIHLNITKTIPNYLKLKINLIKRADSVHSKSLETCHALFGSPNLTKELHKYVLTFTYDQIV
jgi:hypothetical protein